MGISTCISKPAIQNPESRIRDADRPLRSSLQRVRAPESRIQNPQSEMQIAPSGARCSPCARIQNPESRIRDADRPLESSLQSVRQNPESKSRIQDPDRTPSELSQAGVFRCERSLSVQNQNPEYSLHVEEYNTLLQGAITPRSRQSAMSFGAARNAVHSAPVIGSAMTLHSATTAATSSAPFGSLVHGIQGRGAKE